MKAWLWHSQGSIKKQHYPLPRILRSKEMKQRNRPMHLSMIDKNKKPLKRILTMAPGAGLKDPTMEDLLHQPNTEYPYAVAGRVRMPCEGISLADVAAALHVARPLVEEIRKYLEAQSLAPTRL